MKRLSRWAGLMGVVLALPGVLAAEDRVLTVATWGGAYEASQRAAYFEPFTEQTGIEVRTVVYNGGLQVLRDHLASGKVEWDVIDMIQSDASAACDEGLLEAISPAILASAPDGTPPEEDFMAGAIDPCFITQIVFSTVIAYDDRAFPGVKPRTVADFFDLDTFPGKRALRRAPVGMLEWALLSLSVPREQLYDLLSTRRGLELAFRRLDEIREEIVWWTGGDESVELLTTGKVAMATGYNGRFFDAQVKEGAPISVIWDGQLIGFNSWAIPKGSNQVAMAEQFIGFATRTENLAAQANRISYGPARRSARQRIGLHVETRMPMLPHMPTAPEHMDNAVIRDHRWYSQTVRLREQWFREWLERDDEALPADSR